MANLFLQTHEMEEAFSKACKEIRHFFNQHILQVKKIVQTSSYEVMILTVLRTRS